jgi:hypothetical protein
MTSGAREEERSFDNTEKRSFDNFHEIKALN